VRIQNIVKEKKKDMNEIGAMHFFSIK